MFDYLFMQPELCYRVNGTIFSTLSEAQTYCDGFNNNQKTYDENIQYIKLKKEERRKKNELTYTQLGMPFDECRCAGADYSANCLKHMCTCDILDKQFPDEKYDRYVCDYHTNTSHRNKGCYWCRSSDCGKWMC